MKTTPKTIKSPRCPDAMSCWLSCLVLFAALIMAAGCHSASPEKQNKDFFTSGNRQADQRASQRMAQSEQLSGSGEGAGEKGGKKGNGTNGAAQVSEKRTLFERLGGQQGISAIVEDFLPRAMQDPRVNWDRKGVTQGGLSIHAGRSEEWKASPENVAQLKQHLVQFLQLATGGPSQYQGKDLKGAHANMHIANPEFDAVVGDLKVSLDQLRIANTEQKELLAIIESTRPEIVTVR